MSDVWFRGIPGGNGVVQDLFWEGNVAGAYELVRTNVEDAGDWWTDRIGATLHFGSIVLVAKGDPGTPTVGSHYPDWRQGMEVVDVLLDTMRPTDYQRVLASLVTGEVIEVPDSLPYGGADTQMTQHYAMRRQAYDEVTRAAYVAGREFAREHFIDNKTVVPSTLQMWLDRVDMGWAHEMVVWSDDRIDTDDGFVAGRTRYDPFGVDSQITLYDGGGKAFTLLHELAHLRYPTHGEDWAKELADLLRKAFGPDLGDTWIRTYRKHQRIKASASVSDEFDAIHAIRVRHGADENPRVCAHVAGTIESELGYPTVIGFYRGEKNGRRLWAQHVWNVLPDGSVLDATADQWGLDPITVAPSSDERWEPLSPAQREWLDQFLRDNYGRSPTMEDWAFSGV